MQPQAQSFAIPFPTPVEALLVLPLGGVAGARASLNVVPPHILGPFAVCPDIFTGDRAGVAVDAFIQVKEHTHMSADVHSDSLSLKIRPLDPAHKDKRIAVDPGWAPVVESIGELGVPTRHQNWFEPGAGE